MSKVAQFQIISHPFKYLTELLQKIHYMLCLTNDVTGIRTVCFNFLLDEHIIMALMNQFIKITPHS